MWRGTGELDSSKRQVNPVRVTGDSLGRQSQGSQFLLGTVDCSAGGEWWCLGRRQAGWLLLAAHSRRAGGEVGRRTATEDAGLHPNFISMILFVENLGDPHFDCFCLSQHF